MIKKKLRLHDFSTHEGLKAYVRAYALYEEKEYKSMRVVYFGMAILFGLGGGALMIRDSELLAGLFMMVFIPFMMLWIAKTEGEKVRLYKEKIAEIQD